MSDHIALAENLTQPVKRRMPRVYLVRHGETEWSLNGRHTGVSDIPLTENGEKTVKEMGPKMMGAGKLIDPTHLRHIFVSPRKRAQRTAELLFGDNKPDKINMSTEPEVGEWDYGAYEGKLTKDIRKEKPNWDIWTDGCPAGETPGESPQQMSDRVDRVIARVRAIHAAAEECASKPEDIDHSDVIIFSHGHFSRCFIARWCNFPISAGYHFASDAGGLAVLGYQHMTLKEPSLMGLNWYSEDSLARR
ncbi:histidine phosphatase superfamily [Dioszegia hungarica]|uniref:Histidine phosphatase superfamily n=1 Tax=Dioszegia hungarica TaxID=4972 RepID=A0AA38LTE8_9TREE|nr:histidine phosphatase superfamily [Dioszegia hungarica]KAI9636792.1 histidine phosphatase superfamily [Dioszegia hungarica]